MANGQNVGGIYYTVDADTAPLVNSSKAVDEALGKTDRSFKATDAAASKTQHQMTATAKAVKQLGDEAQAAQNPLGGVAKLLAGMVTLQGAMTLITMAESYGEMAERIRMATDSAAEYENVQARLLATANATYRPLKEAQELYILTADSLRSMGYSTDQAIDVVDSMSYAFVKNATSTERSNGAISAFTGAIMTGKLEADGWKTIIAAIPTVVNDLAESTGMTSAEIRKMGAEGKLTAQVLSEGLRKSLDQNKAAADGMANTIKDAFTAASNALQVYIGEANMANGTTGLLSKAIFLFAENLNSVVTALTVIGAGLLAKYIASTTAAAIAAGSAAIAARLQAAEELKLATAHAAASAAAASNASTNALLGGTHAAAAKAADVQAAAEIRLAAAKKAAQAAGVGLIGVLGGPAGIIALAASAAAGFLLMGNNADAATSGVDKLTDGIEKLTAAQLENRKLQAQDAIDALKKKAQDAGGAVKGLEKDYADLNAQMQAGRGGVDNKGLENVNRALTEARAESDGTVQALQQAYDAYNKLAEAEAAQANRRASPGAAPPRQADPEVQKRLAQMREELELAKLTGEARARLQAIQKLGSNATAEERAEAERLAAQIYKLEESRKTLASTSKKAAEEEKKRIEEAKAGYVKAGELLGELALKIQLAQMGGKELAQTQAILAAGQYATPEQIEAIRGLSGQLYEAEQRKAALDKIMAAGGVDAYIGPAAEPITGGPFDTEDARFKAEEEKEMERYRQKAVRLAEAHAFTEMTDAEHYSRVEALAQEHADRMSQIDKVRNETMLKGLVSSTAAMTSGLKSAFGEQSGIYKAAFAVQKAAAIAQSIVAIQTGIAQAAALPFPANIPAMATVAAATAGIVSTIAGTGISGGRQYGGGVLADGMYRINENGAPEVFNAANGRQYMLPNTRGEVVSNADATRGASGGGGTRVTVQLIEDTSRAGTVTQNEQDGETFIQAFVANIRSGGDAAQAIEGTYGLARQGR